MLVTATELEAGRIAVLLAAPTDKAPPKEFRIFARGVTETTKGPILFDDDAAKLVMGAFADQGRDALPFDIAHGMLNPFAPPDAHKAAGWFKPEARGDGLYAAGIEWTELGSGSLRRREFRYFSPAIHRDSESGRVRELINIALTNIPATRHQAPLVADQNSRIEALIARYAADGTLPPSLHDWARTLTPEALEQFCAGMSAHLHATAPRPVAPPKGPDMNAITLTASERDVALKLGISDADFLAEKRRRASGPESATGGTTVQLDGRAVELSVEACKVAALLGLSHEDMARAQIARADHHGG
ncbi:hypothetical protein Rctr16k_21 [Virus Rctr16k]|nr:hypothetical protein Rctr16k_21 [Virus Rctr16k]